jgi:hypothetical protein
MRVRKKLIFLVLPFLTFAQCPSVDKVKEILQINGVKDIEITKVNDYSDVNLCGITVKASGREIEDAFFVTPNLKFLVPRIGKMVSVDAPIDKYKAVYVFYGDKKTLIGYVNPDYKIFLPSLVALKQKVESENKTSEK